ncbi:MAG TPA: trehalose-phosphatase [Gaiellaceae bacterium]|nr:trehalose-phosphatase [Gaiellaceae bacterium]
MDPIARLAEAPARAALLLDVDGTLAPIVGRPEDARVPEETRAELRRLAAGYALVACVTGRAAEVAAEIVGVDGLRYVGEHGLELAPEAAAWAERIHAFADGIARPAERKRLSVAFHWRGDPDPGAAAEVGRIAVAAADAGFRVRHGRKVVDVLPPVDADKGTAVRYLLADSPRVDRALFAGDDTTDLDAFAALGAAGLELAVRVAVASPEGPPELSAAADVVVQGPDGFRELLRRL